MTTTKQIILFVTMTFMMVACKTGKNDSQESQIDVAGNIDKLTELKVSDIASSIRLIPLETTYESLVGNKPVLKIIKDKIIITTEKQCLLFDKETGKFHCSVGHIGNDPEGYSSANCWVNNETGILYFFRAPNWLMKYDTNGKFMGKIETLNTPNSINDIEFTDSELAVFYYDPIGTTASSLVFFNNEGSSLDSIQTFAPGHGLKMSDIANISVTKDVNKYGNMAITGIINTVYKDDQQTLSTPNGHVMWKDKGELRFMELFSDTVYSIKDRSLKPYIVFGTGNWHWAADKKTNVDNDEKRVVITYVTESSKVLFFQCVTGLYTNPQLYNGIYNKETKQTKMAMADTKFIDDISNLLPVQPTTCSPDGEFACLLEATDAIEEADEEMNPVVVLMK